MFILNKSSYPIGLDISDLSLKLVQLNKLGDKIKTQAIGRIDLPAGLIENGEIKNKKEVVKAINKLIANPSVGSVSSNEVIACLPEEKTFLKLVEIEKSLDNTEKKVQREIEKHIPLSLEEIYYDWEIIEDLPKRKLVLIGASPRTLVDQYTNVLEAAKLSVVALESEPISICRSLLTEEHLKYKGAYDKNYGIIDIGGSNACLIVYSKKTILFTASMPISGEEITKEITQTLGIERDEAEKTKISYSLGKNRDDKKIKNIIAKMVNDLTIKNKKAINFYNSHFSNWGPIEKIILCGGGANIKDLDKIIEENTGIETVTGDVLVNLTERKKKVLHFLNRVEIKNTNQKENKKTKPTPDKSLAFATAIGLALRGIFMPYT